MSETSKELTIDESYAFIDAVVDLSSVKRYHGHRVINYQSVADHSARVAMLAFMLALEYYGNEVDAYRVSTYSLFHDVSEGILKNDSNSSIKAKYGIRALLNKLEHDVVGQIFSSDNTNTNILKGLILEDCNKTDYDLLKFCDTADFGLYLWEELGLGNTHLKPLLSSFIGEFEGYPTAIKNLPLAKQIKQKVLSLC